MEDALNGNAAGHRQRSPQFDHARAVHNASISRRSAYIVGLCALKRLDRAV